MNISRYLSSVEKELEVNDRSIHCSCKEALNLFHSNANINLNYLEAQTEVKSSRYSFCQAYSLHFVCSP